MIKMLLIMRQAMVMFMCWNGLKILVMNLNIINMQLIWTSCNGHVNVLEWFKNSDYEFKYYKYAFYGASRHGQVHVLEWFKNNNYKSSLKCVKLYKNIKIDFV
jgi:hypothetical protein